MQNYCFLQNGELLSKTSFCHYFENLNDNIQIVIKRFLRMFFLLFTLFLNLLYFFPVIWITSFRAVFFSLSLFLEFRLISESHHGLSSSRTTIVLFGIHN